MTLQENRARLLSHFAGDASKHTAKWEMLWQKGDFLPWDRGVPNPALAHLLNDRQDLVGPCMVDNGEGGQRRKRALVPGCGKGYDVLLLASYGYDAYGLEVSQTAVERCIEEQEKNGHNYPVQGHSGPGSTSFLLGDFFGTEWASSVDGNGMMDLIHDYTFLSALSPESRPDWALRMSNLTTEKGCLVCIEFPSTKDPKLGGPPFALPPEVYVEHLGHPGKEISYDATGHIKQDHGIPTSQSTLKRKAHFHPERTHQIGEGTDFVSIWMHQSQLRGLDSKCDVDG